ncbi:type A von Willebrand factor domain-containing protein [Planoprotostelium fungivorum]|uniref:Type A von Willebrand factor domain-containing protein n=1 Tax=Planoprotostelium fungivorum TaxID=1890364 RepID=A0A2P6N062_9EUKA|nr:type A von Willebrand factor domain-containing protein [Planoprotostelium fungivorum]
MGRCFIAGPAGVGGWTGNGRDPKGSFFGVLLLVFYFTSIAQATHFRYGLVTWTIPDASTPNQFNFQIQFVWRRSYLSENNCGPCNKAGDQFKISGYTLCTGDGACSAIGYQTVTSLDTTNDWCAATWSMSYTYAAVTTVTSRTIYHTGQNRLSSLQNNHDVAWYLQTTLKQYPSGYSTSGMITASPVSSGLPIVQVRNGIITKYQVPANIQLSNGSWTDAAGNLITFRMSTLIEELGSPPYGSGASSVRLCPGNSIDPFTGIATFNGTSLTSGTRLYQTQHMLDDGRGGIIPIDYILNATDTVGLCSTTGATCTTSGTCGTGTCLYSEPVVITTSSVPRTNPYTIPAWSGSTGSPMTWSFVADDLVIDQAVTITYSGVPTGATFSAQASCSNSFCNCTNGRCQLPQYVTFTWAQPTVGSYQICFAVIQYATNPSTSLSSGQYCVGMTITTQCNSGTVKNNSLCANTTTFTPEQCCTCAVGYDPASRCTSCLTNHYGSSCDVCPTCQYGQCDDGINGDGQCVCDPGWQGLTCNVPVNAFCDPSQTSYVQSQTTGTTINPSYANLYMSVNSQSTGSASINLTVNAIAQPPVDLIVLQDVSSNGDITPLQNSDMCNTFMSNLISAYPSAQAALASVSNYGSTYRRLGILTSSTTTFCSYPASLSINSTATSSQMAVYDAIAAIVNDTYGWQASSYKVIAVVTQNPPSGAWDTALQALSSLGITITIYAQTSSTYTTYSKVVSSAGFGTCYQGSTGLTGNTWYQQIPSGISSNLPQTTANVLHSKGFFDSSTSVSASSLPGKGWALIRYSFPSGSVKGQVTSLPVTTVSIMGWGIVTVEIVLNRAPVSQSVFFQPTENAAFAFNLTGTDADNNLMLARWVTLPNNATLKTSAGWIIQAGTFYNFSQIYNATAYYTGASVGTFQLSDGCDTSAIYNANFSIIPVNYPVYIPTTSNLNVSLNMNTVTNFTVKANNTEPGQSQSDVLTINILTTPLGSLCIDSSLSHCLKSGSVYRGENTVLYYSPPTGAYSSTGPYDTISYSATSPSGHISNVSTISVTVDYVNKPPIPDIPSPLTVYECSYTQFTLAATDDQTPSNELLFYLKAAPTNGTLQLQSGEVGEMSNNYTALIHGGNSSIYPVPLNGETKVMLFYPWGYEYGDNYATFTIIVVDQQGLSAEVNVTVNVIHVDQPPTIVYDNTSLLGFENEDIIISFNGTDIDTPAPLLRGVVSKLPQRGSLYACIYNATDGTCALGREIGYSSGEADVPNVGVTSDNRTAMFRAVFVPIADTSQLVYSVPSFVIYDDYDKTSSTYSPSIRVITITDPPTLTYLPLYTTTDNVTLALTNVSVADPDAGSIRILLRVNVTLPSRLNFSISSPWLNTRVSQCNSTEEGGYNVIQCLASTAYLKLYLQSLTFTSTVVGNHTVGIYVNDLGAGADYDRRSFSYKDASGYFIVTVTQAQATIITTVGKQLTWAIGVGSAGGTIAAAAAVAAVARLVKKPDDDVFGKMFDFDSTGVVDNPLYAQAQRDQIPSEGQKAEHFAYGGKYHKKVAEAGSMSRGSSRCCNRIMWVVFTIFVIFSSFWVGWNLYRGHVYDADIRNTLGYQIHSWNDVREWPQAFKKGATWLKIDIHLPVSNQHPDTTVCDVQENLIPAARKDPRGCLLLSHDAPDIRQKSYNTSGDVVRFLSDERYRHHFQKNETVHIALCLKAETFNPCEGSPLSSAWLSLVDDFIREANDTIQSLGLNVNLVLDGNATPGGGRTCLADRWRPLVSTYIFNSDPFCAALGNNCKGADRFQIWNQPVPKWLPWLLIDLYSYIGYGKFGRQTTWPFLIWEPDRQDIMIEAGAAYVQKGISQKAGFRYAINMDPVMWQVYTSPVSHNGMNERLSHTRDFKRPVVLMSPDGDASWIIISATKEGRNRLRVYRSEAQGHTRRYHVDTAGDAMLSHPITSMHMMEDDVIFMSDSHGNFETRRMLKTEANTVTLGRISTGRLAADIEISHSAVPFNSNNTDFFHLYQTSTCRLQLERGRFTEKSTTTESTGLCITSGSVVSASFDVKKDPSSPCGNNSWSAVVTWSNEKKSIYTSVVCISGEGEIREMSSGLVDVGANPSVSMVSDGDRLYILQVHGEGYDYNTEERNKNPLVAVCDQTPESSENVLVYNWATLSDWVSHLQSNRSVITSCHADIMHGSFDRGNAPDVSVIHRGGKVFDMVETHLGISHRSEEAGSPLSHHGLVLNSWTLPNIS